MKGLVGLAADTDWYDIQSTFRALGGIADNVVLRVENGRRGLFPIIPDQPFKLFVPDTVLVNADQFELRDTQLVLAQTAEVSPDIRAFIDGYNARIAWKGGRAEAEDFLVGLYELPDQLRNFLKEKFYFKNILEKPTDSQIRDQFISSRQYQHNDRTVLFPFLELPNHHPKGFSFESTGEGVLLQGAIQSEILTCYSVGDAWTRFVNYGFPSRERRAFSDLYSVTTRDGSRSINVRKAIDGSGSNSDESKIPLVSQAGSKVDISYLLLGDRADPMIPVNNFRKHVQPTLGKGSDEFFETLSYINKMKFWQLYNICNRHHGPMVENIKLACQFQLEALNYAWFGNWVPTDDN